MDDCLNCHGAHWVCENHFDRPWDGNSHHPDACGCGAGAPCPCCQWELATSGLRYAAEELARVKAVLADSKTIEAMAVAIVIDLTDCQLRNPKNLDKGAAAAALAALRELIAHK